MKNMEFPRGNRPGHRTQSGPWEAGPERLAHLGPCPCVGYSLQELETKLSCSRSVSVGAC